MTTLRGYRPPAPEVIQPRSKLDTGALPGGRSQLLASLGVFGKFFWRATS